MESSGRTLVCSVLFLDIVGYSSKPVSEQLELKQHLNRALSRALEQLPARDRIVLDTADGTAVTFLGDPEDALFAAMTMRDGAAVPLRLGVNLGPVRMVEDLNGQLNVIGDGIDVAQRVMSFARPGQLLVSRSFYEVASCLSRDYAKLFRHESARADKQVRERDVYAVLGAQPPGRRLADAAAQSLDEPAAASWLARRGPLGIRRSALAAAIVAFCAIAAGGVGARAVLERPDAAAKRATDAKQTPPAAKKRAEKHGATAHPDLAVAPWGEIWVDGQSRGVSPPLRTFELAPGAHTVEIRNSTFPARVEQVELQAGEALRIRHRFR